MKKKKPETRGRKPKPDKLVPVMTHLPPETVEKLNQVAKWQDRPVSQIVRMATVSYLRYAMLVISGEITPTASGDTLEALPGIADWVQRGRQELGISDKVVAATRRSRKPPTAEKEALLKRGKELIP
jgi:hypothetical protein